VDSSSTASFISCQIA
jgi:hypothetical protein